MKQSLCRIYKQMISGQKIFINFIFRRLNAVTVNAVNFTNRVCYDRPLKIKIGGKVEKITHLLCMYSKLSIL